MRTYVVEYSQSQRAYHIQPLKAAVNANLRRFERFPLEMFDWVPLFVGTRRACEIAVQQFEKRARLEEAKHSWTH